MSGSAASAASAASASGFRGPRTVWLYSEEKLENPPSLRPRSKRARHGAGAAHGSATRVITIETERAWRREAVGHIQSTAVTLRLPVAVTAHAATLLQRFYCEQSFLEFRKFHVATACLFVAMKLSTDSRVSQLARAKTVLRRALARAGAGDLDEESPQFADHLDEVLHCERALLATLGFNLSAEVPQELVVRYANTMCLGDADAAKIVQHGVRMANSIMGGTFCLWFPAPTIACALVEIAAKADGIELPTPRSGAPWYERVSVTLAKKTEMRSQMDEITPLVKEHVSSEQRHLDAAVQAMVAKRRSHSHASSTSSVSSASTLSVTPGASASGKPRSAASRTRTTGSAATTPVRSGGASGGGSSSSAATPSSQPRSKRPGVSSGRRGSLRKRQREA